MNDARRRNNFTLTSDEADLVYKLVSNALSRSTDNTVRHEIGDPNSVTTATQLYMRLFETRTNDYALNEIVDILRSTETKRPPL